ncbi:TonB-dependent receptor plug domain-containing protein, partial [Escherichia coli]|uniref:TonB-dependent receptor plug domain-containing protein n=1 Tax=Escherichia coli TaxID=562 RepID=UPI00129057C5
MHALSKTVATALVAGSSLSPAAAQLPPPEPAASAAPRSVRPDQPTARPPAADAPAPAAEQLRRVEVEGRASDESIRRAATASKIVITREEIDRFGDSTLGEVIKRLPGVTTGGRPGRGGDIRMRGMGGG